MFSRGMIEEYLICMDRCNPQPIGPCINKLGSLEFDKLTGQNCIKETALASLLLLTCMALVVIQGSRR
jgi:hypothetical protein